jgi:hypothetical protein
MNRSQATKTGRSTQRRRKTAERTRDGADGSSYATQAIAMLTQDHEAVKKLFRDGDRASDDPDQLLAIVQQACAALTEHADIEEEFFYPALREADADLVAEAQVEHNCAKQLIADLESIDADDERFRATFKVLGEYVVHHIDEEEREMFPLASASKADFEPLFEALSARNDAAGVEASAADDGTRAPEDKRPRAASRATPRSGR